MVRSKSHVSNGGFAPATPGFNAVAPEWLFGGGAANLAAPAIPAAESTLGSHPCVALSSAQVFPEWINRNLAGNAFAANGDNPLNFVSHARGSLQPPVTAHCTYPSIWIDPSDSSDYSSCGLPNTVDFWKSTDGGDLWTQKATPVGSRIWNLTLGPGSPAILYMVDTRGAIWKSTDGA